MQFVQKTERRRKAAEQRLDALIEKDAAEQRLMRERLEEEQREQNAVREVELLFISSAS